MKARERTYSHIIDRLVVYFFPSSSNESIALHNGLKTNKTNAFHRAPRDAVCGEGYVQS